MASLYQRVAGGARSPFWWCKWRDPKTGETVRASTGFRIGIGTDFKKAREFCNAKSLAESQSAKAGKDELWENWVPGYLALRYTSSPRTHERVLGSWHFIQRYLDDRALAAPRFVTRAHCLNYIEWRRAKNKAQGFNGVSLNTALMDLKLLSVLMGEAVNRGWATANPAFRLGVRKTAPKPKPEITDEEIALIRAKIQERRALGDMPYGARYDWGHILHVTFEIALNQGVRLSETHLDLRRDVDLDHMVIHFHMKGDKWETKPLNPVLVPLFRELRAAGRSMTYDPPPQRTMVSLAWRKFLHRIGLPHLSFHSTRVTAISRLERAGAPESIVMKLVNHSSTTVHRVYRRLQTNELSKYWPSIPAAPTTADTPHDSPPCPSAPSTTPEHAPLSPDGRNQTGAQGACNG